ncbi:MAG: fumarylacetoacetate hydrolase family protein [Phycisphaerales bacterium]|nr:fumarylacetoacetate hydrolase family protein [Phycisphaerales bacterium]
MKNPPPTIWCIGRNYLSHANEMGQADASERPTMFMKNPAAVISDGDPIIIPPVCDEHGPQVDYEGELAVILGNDIRDADPTAALASVSHYAAANDVTARWWQKQGAGGQWIRGKSFDTFCPIGPLADAASISDVQSLHITTRVNGVIMQDASTADMIFPIGELLSELSRGTTLLAGTVLLSGTPGGVGSKRTPPQWLGHGDVVEVEIEHVGSVRNTVQSG